MTETDVDAVALAAELIRCRSVTPAEGGALTYLAERLSAAGFSCRRVDRGATANLFARWGEAGHPRSFGFNGHTDVVPAGDEGAWRHPPFAAEIADGRLWGRGAADMKSAVAAFTAAAMDFVRATPPDGAVILAITGDEEGAATDGTPALLDEMARSGERMSVCLVGEPTCPERLGEAVKIGRRGSMTAGITATGVQGHSAYPFRARNAAAAMARLMDRLSAAGLDAGTAHFDPSTLAVTSIDTDNPAHNVIPETCRGRVNIRFNDAHDGAGLTHWLREIAARVGEETGVGFEVTPRVSGESFVTAPGPFTDLVARAVESGTGIAPALSTAGGTSDARFVKDHCPVVEFGLVGRTIHQTDEHVEIADIHTLKAVYRRILADWFA